MSTNFYAHPRNTKFWGTDPIHIGKSSGGWSFLWHAIPSAGLTSVEAWVDLLLSASTRITDEYGRKYSFFQFIGEVRSTDESSSGPRELYSGQYVDKFGNVFDDHDFC